MDTKALAEKLMDELLLAAEPVLYPTDEMREPVLEVEINSTWREVDHETWRSWTGRRMVNGTEHHGPVFSFMSPDGASPFTGARTCTCPLCQEHVAPQFRPN